MKNYKSKNNNLKEEMREASMIYMGYKLLSRASGDLEMVRLHKQRKEAVRLSPRQQMDLENGVLAFPFIEFFSSYRS